MSKLIIAFPLLMVALIGIAIYVQITSSTLSLPISTGTTVLTILLPLFAVANLFYTPILNRLTKSSNVQQFLLPALHILQGGLTVVIATLAAQGFTPGAPLKCELEGAWQLLWHKHDGRAIERIQNAFDCCGFHSVVDRPWPKQECQKIYGRHIPCDGPWSASMQRTSGLQFAVAVLCGMIQLAHLVYFKRRGQRDNANPAYKHRAERAERGENGRLIEEAYHDGDDSGVGEDQSPPQSALPAPQVNQDEGPRVEPSGLGRDEANEWGSYDE
ncbi:hypothetical protein F5B22DRAFT_425404 [Xylaria bambusicola]|uniref:uncharacterized protein n=1 Tax=Xylaria bambusicola TaxID=326684 RepID=UPI00200787BA|nr:uncharacterized protein F5B22DRAFT_425404 [Xylaria bambusicola]KAI0508305.1 hypothetical protein F5B22DRAFT_425404 [Xylaria bambusicola]